MGEKNLLVLKTPNVPPVPMDNKGTGGKKPPPRRDWDLPDVMEYRDGLPPRALLNFLVRLGGTMEDQEIFSIDEMIALFDPKDINRSASNYNLDKLLWLNSHYIKNSSDKRLIKLLKDFGVDLESNPKSSMILNATKERGKTIKELQSRLRRL